MPSAFLLRACCSSLCLWRLFSSRLGTSLGLAQQCSAVRAEGVGCVSRQTLASVQALQGVAEKARTSTPWLNSNPTLREMLDRQLAENNPSTPRSPFDNGAGPNLASVGPSSTIGRAHLHDR